MANLNGYIIDEVFVEKLEDGMVPIWIDNGQSCFRSAIQLPTGTIDCTFVQTCMLAITTATNNTLTTHTAEIAGLALRTTTLEGLPQHTHLNLTALNNIIDGGTAEQYLGADGNYHPMGDRRGYYNGIETIGGGTFAREQIMAFNGTQFDIVEDPANGRTIISINPAILGGGGGGADGNDYSVSGIFDPITSILTINRTNGSFNVDLTSIGNDEFVDTATFDPVTNILTLSRNVGIDLTVDLGAISFSENTTPVTALNVVNIAHGLGRHPEFNCVDSAGEKAMPGVVSYTDANNAVLNFSPAFTGNIFYI